MPQYNCKRCGSLTGVIYCCLAGEWKGYYLCEKCESICDHEGRDKINNAILKSTGNARLKIYRKKQARALSTRDEEEDIAENM